MFGVIHHTMKALFPSGGSLPGVADTDLDAFLQKFMRESGFIFRLGVWSGSLIFALTPLLTLGIPLPSFLLPKRLLDRHAEKITSHPWYLLRQAVLVPKMAAGLCWAAHPSVRRSFELPPYAADPGTWRTE